MGFTGREHEEATVRSFIVPEKQERLLSFLSKEKDRKKLTMELHKSGMIDKRFSTLVPWKVDPSLKLQDRYLQGIEKVVQILRSRGAGPTCWAISTASSLDGRELDLAFAIRQVGGGNATILSCLPGKLAYFQDEYESLLLAR